MRAVNEIDLDLPEGGAARFVSPNGAGKSCTCSRGWAATTRGQIAELLDVVGLHERGGDRYKHYSLGMKQHLGIALALLPNPDLLILDEPTNELDPKGPSRSAAC